MTFHVAFPHLPFFHLDCLDIILDYLDIRKKSPLSIHCYLFLYRIRHGSTHYPPVSGFYGIPSFSSLPWIGIYLPICADRAARPVSREFSGRISAASPSACTHIPQTTILSCIGSADELDIHTALDHQVSTPQWAYRLYLNSHA